MIEQLVNRLIEFFLVLLQSNRFRAQGRGRFALGGLRLNEMSRTPPGITTTAEFSSAYREHFRSRPAADFARELSRCPQELIGHSRFAKSMLFW
jgi:hypothetical protein